MKSIKNLLKRLFHEELDIHHRLLNLILSAALIGGVISLAATVALGDYLTAFVVVILLLVVLLSLYLSVFRNRTYHIDYQYGEYGDISVDVFLFRRSIQQHAALVCAGADLYMADLIGRHLLLYVCVESGCNDWLYYCGDSSSGAGDGDAGWLYGKGYYANACGRVLYHRCYLQVSDTCVRKAEKENFRAG